jgi:hypothetical protein
MYCIAFRGLLTGEIRCVTIHDLEEGHAAGRLDVRGEVRPQGRARCQMKTSCEAAVRVSTNQYKSAVQQLVPTI